MAPTRVRGRDVGVGPGTRRETTRLGAVARPRLLARGETRSRSPPQARRVAVARPRTELRRRVRLGVPGRRPAQRARYLAGEHTGARDGRRPSHGGDAIGRVAPGPRALPGGERLDAGRGAARPTRAADATARHVRAARLRRAVPRPPPRAALPAGTSSLQRCEDSPPDERRTQLRRRPRYRQTVPGQAAVRANRCERPDATVPARVDPREWIGASGPAPGQPGASRLPSAAPATRPAAASSARIWAAPMPRRPHRRSRPGGSPPSAPEAGAPPHRRAPARRRS